MLNLLLHFAKIAFFPYRANLPSSLSSISAESICALSTIVFPIIFWLKKENPLHDFMFFIGVCSGLAAIIFPSEPLGKPFFSFDVLRFYFCHFSLIVVPLSSAMLGLHVPKPKNFFIAPICFFAYQFIIFLNEFALFKFGIVNCSVREFFSKDYRNISQVFGPMSKFDAAEILFEPLVPNIFKFDASGSTFYMPVVWLTFPVLLYFPIIYLLLVAPFYLKEKHMKKTTQKAGCILVDKDSKKIGLIFRDYRNDYEFAKGHVDPGETLVECAVRETAEETKRTAEIVPELEPFVEKYTTPSGEQCENHLFIATDVGKSDNASTDTHTFFWVDIDEVEKYLSYQNLKELWNKAKPIIKDYYKFD